MKNYNNIGSLEALHKDLLTLLEKKKLNIKKFIFDNADFELFFRTHALADEERCNVYIISVYE